MYCNEIDIKKSPLLPEEEEINNKLVEAWNLFMALPQTHPSDVDEFRTAIHDLQKIIGMRILRREFPFIYPQKK